MTNENADAKRALLDETYLDSYKQVLGYLDEIRERIHDLPAPETEGLHWGHVGDMNKIKNDLREVVDFLNGYGE
jgi:hypothetical protein